MCVHPCIHVRVLTPDCVPVSTMSMSRDRLRIARRHNGTALTYARMHACMYTCMCMHVDACMHVHMHVHAPPHVIR